MNNPSRVAFTLFGRDVYWYGVLMALGILDSEYGSRSRRASAKSSPRTTYWICAL